MTEVKTYYGPWMNKLPQDAPSGSLWQGWHKSDSRIHAFVVVGNDILNERDGLGAEWCQQFRRVWPPGSIPAEPRPTVDVMCSDIARRWPIWVLSHGIKPVGPLNWYSVTLEPGDTFPLLYLGNTWIGSLCYPAQRLKNGTLAPVPWFDSGCTTE